MLERTLVIIKPDAVSRGIIGEVITRFERAGFKIIGIKMLKPDRRHYHHHYETIGKMISRRGEKAFEVTLDFMMKGPVIALVLEGVDAVALVRKLVGTTEPSEAVPGTIRGDYAHINIPYANSRGKSIPNIVHASGDSEEAKAEIEHWFKPAELLDHKTVYEQHTTLAN